MPEPRLRDAMIQQRIIGRMEDAVSSAGDESGEIKSPEGRRRRNQDSGTCQERDAQTKHAMRAPAIYQKPRQRLPRARNDIEHRHQRANVRIRQ